jgi:hypothetical protein
MSAADKSAKKRKHDSSDSKSGDFVIEPASETPKLDTSKYEDLLSYSLLAHLIDLDKDFFAHKAWLGFL